MVLTAGTESDPTLCKMLVMCQDYVHVLLIIHAAQEKAEMEEGIRSEKVDMTESTCLLSNVCAQQLRVQKNWHCF